MSWRSARASAHWAFHYCRRRLGISIGAGFLGALVGLGGGIIVIPALTLGLGVNNRYAIGASIVSVVAASSGVAAAYVRERLRNLRVAMLLETATTTGAISGAYLAGFLSGRWLYVLLGILRCYSAFAMLVTPRPQARAPPADAWADFLQLHGSSFDEATGQERI